MSTATLPAPATPVPSRQAVQAKTRSQSNKVTGALAVAIKAIIEEGLELDQAATRAGITTRNLRLALERPHVISWMKAQREVFRAYICAQNIHYAAKLRNDSTNAMAQLGAIKVLEAINENAASSAAPAVPGLIIQIVQSAGANTTVTHAPMQIVDTATTINHE